MFMRIINRTEEAVICILLVAITLLVFADVVMRFGFNMGLMWSQELTLHMSAWFVLFGASYGLKVGSHIGMDAFVKLFSFNTRRLLSGFAAVLALVYCYLVLYGSWIYLAKMKKIGITMEDLPIPVWLANGMLFVGFVFLTVRLLILLFAIITGKTDGFKHADEAKESMALAKEILEGEKHS
jgi:C4-dicarboxylate transporter DctQ subunit